MRRFTLGELSGLMGAELTANCADLPVTGFATDSREVRPGDLFLAIRGENVDGHDFVGAALQRGAVGGLIERPVSGHNILTPNLADALARFASELRSRFNGPVVGITGSAGKTTTKELVAAALSPLGRIAKTEGNRNTEYTAPLLWAEIEPDTAAVVAEMAMRGFGQIAHLAAFTKPTIGLITNIGYSHMLQVGSREGIAQAKGELFEALGPEGVGIVWNEDPFADVLRSKVRSGRVRTFGAGSTAECRITDYRPLSWSSCEVEGSLGASSWHATLPAVGRHIALNAAGAVLTASEAGVEPEEAAHRLSGAKLPPMRMEVVALGGATVLLDTYNAAPPSMIAAIETLAELPVSGRRLAVIGEMKELGEHTIEAHRSVGRSLAASRIDRVLLIGEPTRYVYEAAVEAGLPEDRLTKADSIEQVERFLSDMEVGDVALVKGSRALGLERALPRQEVRP